MLKGPDIRDSNSGAIARIGFPCPLPQLTLLTSDHLISWPTLPIISLIMPHSWCKCQSCLLSGPQGCSFSKPDFKIHQLWLWHEHDDQQVAAQAAAEQGLFTVAVVDPGSDLNNALSTMWNSWEHVQAQASFSADNTSTIFSAASAVMEGVHHIALFSHFSDPSLSHVTNDLVTAFDHLGIRGPHRINEGVNALQNMSFTNPWQPITSLDTKTSSSPVDMPSTDPIQYPMDSPPANSHIPIPWPSCDKQENNVLTTHALKTLMDVERLMQTCAAKLNDMPTESLCHNVENTVSQSCQTVDRVTCSTPSIDTLNEKVVWHILHIQNWLIELDTLHCLEIKANPMEYLNGES